MAVPQAVNGRVLSQRMRSAGMSHAVGHVDGGPLHAGQHCDRTRAGWSLRALHGPLREADALCCRRDTLKRMEVDHVLDGSLELRIVF